jgi:hypothetical protein
MTIIKSSIQIQTFIKMHYQTILLTFAAASLAIANSAPVPTFFRMKEATQISSKTVPKQNSSNTVPKAGSLSDAEQDALAARDPLLAIDYHINRNRRLAGLPPLAQVKR